MSGLKVITSTFIGRFFLKFLCKKHDNRVATRWWQHRIFLSLCWQKCLSYFLLCL